jgi:hypothetical protein
MWIVVSLLIVGIFAVIAARSICARSERLQQLRQSGRISTWEDIEHSPARLARIVRVNFGYGKEIWALNTERNEIDLELKSFRNGFLIVPHPQSSTVGRFCQSHGIPIIDAQIKM